MCACTGTSWGWMPNDPVSDFDWLIKMMVDVICRDGNWLLNVGPDKDGHIPAEVAARLREIGAWLKENGESVYKTRGGPFEPVDNVYGATFRDNTVYLHILDVEAFRKETLPNIPYKIMSASYKGCELKFTQEEQGVTITLPEQVEKEADTIVVLTVEGQIAPKEADIHFTGKE